MPGPIGNFFATATYFESKARKAKGDDGRRADLMETARFYRTLGRITPTFPYGYKQPRLSSAASRLEQRAEECRAIAASMGNLECKARMLRLADSYQKTARSTGAAAAWPAQPARVTPPAGAAGQPIAAAPTGPRPAS